MDLKIYQSIQGFKTHIKFKNCFIKYLSDPNNEFQMIATIFEIDVSVDIPFFFSLWELYHEWQIIFIKNFLHEFYKLWVILAKFHFTF